MRTKLATKNLSLFAKTDRQLCNWSIYSTFKKWPDNRIYISTESSHYISAISAICKLCYDEKWIMMGNWWCHNLDQRSPIAECGFAIHANLYLSAVLTARYGASEAILENLTQYNAEGFSINKDPNYTGQRTMIGILVPLTEKDKLLKFFDTAALLCPMGFPKSQFQSMMDYILNASMQAKIAQANAKVKEDSYCFVNLHDEIHAALLYPELPQSHHVIYPHAYHVSPFILNLSRRYIPAIHAKFIKGQSPLNKAILANNIKAVDKIIDKDPYSVFRANASHDFPLDVALYTGKRQIFERLYHHAKGLELNCRYIQWQLDFPYKAQIEIDETYRRTVQPDAVKESIKNYKDKANEASPRRHAIHEACLAGQNDNVIQMLQQNPALLTLQDPWGFTVTVLACALGNIPLLEQLLLMGASVAPTKAIHWASYSLVHNAPNEAVLKVLFYHYADPNERTTLIEEAIRNHYVNILRQFYRYGRDDIRSESGLTPIEQTIAHAQLTGNTELLRWLLIRQEDYVYDGPFDHNISPEIRGLLQDHNEFIRQKRYKLNTRPKVLTSADIRLSADKLVLSTTLHQNLVIQDQEQATYQRIQNIYHAHLKSTADLSEEELAQIKALYLSRLTLRGGYSDTVIDSYLAKILPKDRSKNVFIEYYTHENKLFSFFSFAIKTDHFPSIGQFSGFFGNLAVCRPDYGSLGLNTLVFRIPHAMKIADANTTIIAHFKSLRPGFSYNLVDSNGSHIFPKFHHDMAFMQHVAQLAGETMVDKGHAPTLHKITDKIPLTPTLEDFEELVGDNPEHGLLLTWTITPDSIESYLQKKLQTNQFDMNKLKATATCWHEFHQAHLTKLMTPEYASEHNKKNSKL